MYNINIDITQNINNPPPNYLYSDTVWRLSHFLLGVICPSCNYPANQDFVLVDRSRDLYTVLPAGWNSDIFFTTLDYIAPNMVIIFYKDALSLTAASTPKPDAYLHNTDNYSISDINSLGFTLSSLGIFLFANTDRLSLVDHTLYFAPDPEIKRWAIFGFGNSTIPVKSYMIWNIAHYIIKIAQHHYEGQYFCPVFYKIKDIHITNYSSAVINRLSSNHFNYPYRKVIFGPTMLSGDLFSIIYTNVIIRKVVKMQLRRFLGRKNNAELWSEVESELRGVLNFFESAPCGPYIINVIVNDPDINNPQSNQLNVEIQYSNAAGLSAYHMPPLQSTNVPPIGRYIATANVTFNLNAVS